MIPVRRAELNDACALAALAERTFRATFGAFNTPANMDAYCSKAYGAEIQASEIANPEIECFVCEGSGALIGYAQLRWRSAPSCVSGKRPAEVQRIYVDVQWQGKGVAQALMSELVAAAARGRADRIWLGVWENNRRAMAFYEKTGFHKVGDHTFQLGDDPQLDWILCRDLRDLHGSA